MTTSVRRRLLWGLASLVGVAGFAAFHFVHLPHGSETSICLFRRLTGIACPGCGLTRAFAAMAKGEWWLAITFHPLAPILALEFLALWITWGREVFANVSGVSATKQESGGLVLGVRSEWLAKAALANGAALLALWLGRLATGTLPR